MKRVALYVRVRTAGKSRKVETVAFDRDPTVQEAPLRQLVAQRGWQVPHLAYHGVMPLNDGVHPELGACSINLTFRRAS